MGILMYFLPQHAWLFILAESVFSRSASNECSILSAVITLDLKVNKYLRLL